MSRTESARARRAVETTKPLRVGRVPVDKIRLHPANRRDMGDLRELAESIRTEGLEQPVTLQQRGEVFEVVDGRRRFTAAATLLRWRTIPAIIRDPRPHDEVLAAVVGTDLHKKPLTHKEKRQAVEDLRQANWSVREMAEHWGVAVSTIRSWMADPREPKPKPTQARAKRAPSEAGTRLQPPRVSAIRVDDIVDRWQRRIRPEGLAADEATALLDELRALSRAARTT